MHVHVVEHRLHWIVAALDWFDAAYLSSAFALANAVAMACRSLPLRHAERYACDAAAATTVAVNTARAVLRQLCKTALDALVEALEYALHVVRFAELLAMLALTLLGVAAARAPADTFSPPERHETPKFKSVPLFLSYA